MYDKFHNLTIYYEKYGIKKDTILILPGWGNTRETFKYIINSLKENYTIYILDYPGFGNSPEPNKILTIYDYALLVKDFIEKQNIISPTIIAHSFGGRLTAIFQGYYKLSFNKIILIDVAGIKRKKSLKTYLKEKTYKLLKKFSYLLPKLKQVAFRQKLLLHFASADYKAISPTMQKTFQNIINENLKKYYRKIETETLIIWGENDQDTPLKDGKLLEKIIKNSALIVYKRASHFSYLEYIDLTNRILLNYLKEEKKP